MFIPRTCYIDCIYRLQYSSLCKINGVLTLGMPPRSGSFDMPSSNPLCFSTQPGRGVVGMSWIGALLISSCITVTFIKGGMLLHTKLNNSQMHFRDIPIDYHDQ